MAVSVVFLGADDGDDGPFSLASAAGWQAASKWIEKLPANYRLLKELVAQGAVENSAGLSEEASEAIEKVKPVSATDRQVVHTLRGFINLLGVGDTSESVVIIQED